MKAPGGLVGRGPQAAPTAPSTPAAAPDVHCHVERTGGEERRRVRARRAGRGAREALAPPAARLCEGVPAHGEGEEAKAPAAFEAGGGDGGARE